MCNNNIELEHIDIKIVDLPKELFGFTIAHISDVHIPNNILNINTISTLIENEKPDVIAMTGDLIYKYKEVEEDKLSNFCFNISKIAKTYAVTGNHESWSDIEKCCEIMNSNGVTIIDNKFDFYKRNDTSVLFMGLKEGSKYSDLNFDFVIEKKVPKILLSHRPELLWDYSSDLNCIKPDLVFCGHAHGGQFRVPFINKGIYSPDQGIFPKYSSGLYFSSNKTQMVVSRGLGNSTFPIRINNMPHIPIIRLK
ncbi:metallophosphoesterase [Sedimentibacter sp. MB31-C6]|uniref:metallophosphoesterase n=1 Tax=Sedimentibacter sp. MB31-C6 TaxID=3109366 RepID=UPI002DDDAA1E|nr:metallophosphoesterase [Sedimentibacter sp. MB36-C1]WSI03239.1 metallophosphoesterase [Sedimentibacter sp. MB36-C1]